MVLNPKMRQFKSLTIALEDSYLCYFLDLLEHLAYRLFKYASNNTPIGSLSVSHSMSDLHYFINNSIELTRSVINK